MKSQDSASTSAWFLSDSSGVDAATKGAFELVEFTIDGQPRPIRRSARQGSQTYTVHVGTEEVAAAEPVAVAYTYRAVVPIDGHLLQLRVDQPTKGLSIELDYGDTGVEYMDVLDYITSSRRTQVRRSPEVVGGKQIGVDFDGWVLPRSGVAFVWSGPTA